MIRKLACPSTIYPVVCVMGNYLKEKGRQESLPVSWRPYHLCKEKKQNSFERQQCVYFILFRELLNLHVQ